MNLILSDKTVAHFAKWIQQKGAIGLRLTLKKAGCVGYEYVIEPVQEQPHPLDICTEHYGQSTDNKMHCIVWVDPSYAFALEGLRIECVQEGLNWRLDFQNPQTEHQCGCGSSFSFKACEGQAT